MQGGGDNGGNDDVGMEGGSDGVGGNEERGGGEQWRLHSS